MTYLEIVNKVLRRLREREVSSVSESTYSKLIGELVNEARIEVENSWDWSGLRVTLSANTTEGVFNYELNGSGNRATIINVLNATSKIAMEQKSSDWFDQQFTLGSPQSGVPRYYTFNGLSLDDDSQIDIYPIPDGNYTIRFNVVLRQPDLVNDSDPLYIPPQPVILLAYAKAIEERGEDNGASATSALQTAVRNWNDSIALDASKRVDLDYQVV
jgi:hypothetical protein